MQGAILLWGIGITVWLVNSEGLVNFLPYDFYGPVVWVVASHLAEWCCVFRDFPASVFEPFVDLFFGHFESPLQVSCPTSCCSELMNVLNHFAAENRSSAAFIGGSHA